MSPQRTRAGLACLLACAARGARAVALNSMCQAVVGPDTFDFSPLRGKNWTVADGRDSFSYRFSLCDALKPAQLPSPCKSLDANTGVAQFNSAKNECFKIGSANTVMGFEHKKGIQIEFTERGATCFHSFRVIFECDMAIGVGRPLSVNEVTSCVYETIWPSSLGCKKGAAVPVPVPVPAQAVPTALVAVDKRPAPAPGITAAPSAGRTLAPAAQASTAAQATPGFKPLFPAAELDKGSTLFGPSSLFKNFGASTLKKSAAEGGGDEAALAVKKTPVEQGLSLAGFALLGYCVLGALFKALVQKESGLDAVPHINTLRNIPVLLKDRCRSVTSAGSFRGGYTKVPGEMVETGNDEESR